MRTTLFFTAALATMNFAFQASAVSITPTEPQLATELAQLDAASEAFLDSDLDLTLEAEKIALPATMDELIDILQNGSSKTGTKNLRIAIRRVLNDQNLGGANGALV